MTSKLLVRGSINIDEFFEIEHIVRSGETISSTGFSRRAGGKGANQAVAAAKAGASVDFAGTIGKDGSWLRETLEGYGVGISLLATDEELPTGRAIIQLSTSTADNSIVLLPGSNFASSSSLPTSTFASSPPPYSQLLLQNEIPLSETLSALSAAHEAGVKTVWNPSPMPSRKELEAFPWEMLDHLLINEGEGGDLLRALTASEEEEVATGGEEENVEDLLKKLRTTKLGAVQGIVMTRGAQGVTASWKSGGNDGGEAEVVTVGAGKVAGQVVDTTGAGDCFTGFFATLLSALPASKPLSPSDLKQVLTVACQAAAMCCEKNGAMESVPSLREVTERMGEEWEGSRWERLRQ